MMLFIHKTVMYSYDSNNFRIEKPEWTVRILNKLQKLVFF